MCQTRDTNLTTGKATLITKVSYEAITIGFYSNVQPLIMQYKLEAELVGCIIADMTFLKTEGRIKPEEPSESSTYSNNPQKLYWAVHFELVMVVEGRNLRYEARWPLSKDLKEGERQGIHAKGQVSIAAAFQPGTA